MAGSQAPAAVTHVATNHWQGYWRRSGWGIAAGLALMLLAIPVVGARVSSYDALLRAVASGDVTHVDAAGMLRPSSTGYGRVEVSWRNGLLTRLTEVTDASSPREADSIGYGGEWDPVEINLRNALRSEQPGLTISRAPMRASYSELAGWRIPLWLGLPVFALCLLSFMLVVSGPQPRRANRWAWAWLVLASPLGIAAYLVLGGPTGLTKAPDPAKRRMRGGMGFLLSLGLAAFMPWTRG